MSNRFGAAFGTLAVNVANLAFGVVTGIISARGLAPDDRGIFVALILWTGLIAALSLLGLEQAIVFRGGGSWTTASAQAKALRRPAYLQVLPFVVASLAVNLFVVRQHGSYVPLAVLATLTIPFNAVTQLSLAPLLAGSRSTLWNAIRLLPAGVYAAGAAALLATDRFSLSTGVFAWVTGGAIAAGVSWTLLRGGCEFDSPDVDVAALRSYGRGVTVASAPSMVRGRIDQLVLGIVAAPSQLGVYAVAVSLAAVAEVLVVTMDQLLFPRFVAHPELASRARGIALAAGACGMVLVLPAALFGRPVIGAVYGVEYVGAAAPLVVLVAGVAVRLGVVVLAARAKARRQLKALIRAETVSLLFSCAMIGVLWPIWGQVGAAVAVVAGQLAAGVMMWFAVDKEVRDEPSNRAAR